jgi:hypothetical protein
MSGTPAWLPVLMTLSDADGDWPSYLAAIYARFIQDFITTKPTYPARRFAIKRHPLILDKEATFWHLISEGQDEAERTPDMRRCERICWPRAMLDHLDSGEVLVWENRRRDEVRVLIALPDFSYVVVLADRGEYILLWTAYPVEQPHRRRKLQQEYEAWQRLKG